jgi:hypothetical protein
MEKKLRYPLRYVVRSLAVGVCFLLFFIFLFTEVTLTKDLSNKDTIMFWKGLGFGLVSLIFAIFFFFNAVHMLKFRIGVIPKGFTLNNLRFVPWKSVEKVEEERLGHRRGWTTYRLALYYYDESADSRIRRLRITQEIEGYEELKLFFSDLPCWSSKIRTKLL